MTALATTAIDLAAYFRHPAMLLGGLNDRNV